MVDYYGSEKLRKQAEWLDANIGDIREDKSIPKAAADGRHVDFLNQDMGSPVSQTDGRDALDAHVKDVVARLDAAGLSPDAEGTSNAPRNQSLDIDLSDIDFDDESTNDDLTDAPSTLNPKQELDHTLTKVSRAAENGIGAKELSSAIDDQLLASITGFEAEHVSKLELRALTARDHLQKALSDEPQDPVAVAAAKKLYTDALQDQLNYHEALAQQHATFLTSNFENKLTNEPLLSANEIAQLNNNIKPTDIAGRRLSPEELSAMRDAVDQATGKDNPGEDFFRTPARLQQHDDAVRKAASELSLPDGWDVVFDDEDALAEISKIPGRLERRAAYKAYALNSRPRHLVIKHKDPALNKHNMMFELDSNDSSMMTTPEEVNTVLNALTEFHNKLDISNLQNVLGNSYTSTFNPTGAIDVKVGRHAPLREGNIGVNRTSKAVINAATDVHGELYINIDRMRLFDTPEFRKEKEGFYWNEPKNGLDKLKTTLYHELGHQIQYATTDSMSPSEIKGKATHIHEPGEVTTEYASASNGEHFAESIGRYISTGEATDRVKSILDKNGLVKSTESDKLPASENNSDYRMNHQPPTRKEAAEEDGVAASLDKIDEVFPKDILDPSKQRNYSSGYPEADKEAFDVINSIKGNPDAEVTIYRGVPGNVDDIQPGNWVTLSKKYAQEHINSNVPGGKILAKKVKASDLFTNADSIQEWGWDPASPFPDAEGVDRHNADNLLEHLGIDFQSATMDASGTRLPTPGAFTGEFQNIMKGAKSWKEVQDRLKGKTITYFDFETTGIADYDGQNIKNDSVQLGAVQVKDGKIIKRFNIYTNPESKLSDWSANNLGRDIVDENGDRILDENGKPKTTKVTPEWLAQQMSKEEAIKQFVKFIGPNALLGGQNVPFDVEILKRMADDAGIKLDIAGTIDSKDLASLLPKYDPEKGIDGPKAPDRKTGEIKATSSLGPVANFLGFEPANWHSADGDAEDSYNLVSKLIDRAAKEDNQDLSLLDFPAMKKRYEERMAEFNDVVSPNNPITENQEKALDRFTDSRNLNIAAIANKALKTAKTRGEAAETLKTLHMLENQKAPEASEPELESLFGYRKNLYKTINNYLRKPEADRKVSPKTDATIAAIDSLIEKQTPTTEPVTVFRGLSGDAAEKLMDSAKGDIFVEPGFSSTSGSQQTMWAFAYGTKDVGAELHLTLPPGSKFIDVDNYIPEQAGPFDIAREHEALLPRGLKFRIDSVDGKVITATVLGSPEAPSPDAEGAPDIPQLNKPLDIDLSDFDFDDDGELEPNEIAAAAKAIAASGIGASTTSRKTTGVLDTKGAPVSIEGSSNQGQAPSQQATETKNKVLDLGSQILDAASKSVDEKLRKEGLLPEGVTAEDYIVEATAKEEAAKAELDSKISEKRKAIQAALDAELAKVIPTVTEKDLEEYLARRGIPAEIADTMTLDDTYRDGYEVPDERWGKRYVHAQDDIGKGYTGPKFDSGGHFEYTFRGGAILADNKTRIAIEKLLKTKSSDYPELEKLASESRDFFDEKTNISTKNLKDRHAEITRDSIVEEMKKAGVEFDSVDMSEYVGKLEPRAGRLGHFGDLSKKTRAELQKAFDYIPKDILLSARAYLDSIQAGKIAGHKAGKIGIIESKARAHFSKSSFGGAIRGDDADAFLHEFWHFFQLTNPDISTLEHAFLYDRLKSRNGGLPSSEAIDRSLQFIGGDFTSQYTTKQYPEFNDITSRFSPHNKYTEVSTTGMQDLFTSPGEYSAAKGVTLYVGSGRSKSSYRDAHMDIATGIWYTDSSMTTKVPGQDTPGVKLSVRGRRKDLGTDKSFRAFNIGLMLSLMDWNNK
jgi:DNA polymerase III epsilon subunit-like protein